MGTRDAMSAFLLDPRLESTSIFISDHGATQLRLVNDARFPWVLVIPRVPDARELIDLDADVRQHVMERVFALCQVFQAALSPTKLNIGALGNIVPQLHIHVIARYETDESWPGPVWGRGQAIPYTEKTAQRLIAQLCNGLETVSS